MVFLKGVHVCLFRYNLWLCTSDKFSNCVCSQSQFLLGKSWDQEGSQVWSNKSAESSFSLCHPAAPSAAVHLQAASTSTEKIRASWQAGPGRLENFRVLLTDWNGVPLQSLTVKNTTTSVDFEGLQPGTQYTVTVVAEAAGLQSSTSTDAITGWCYRLILGFYIDSFVILSPHPS